MIETKKEKHLSKRKILLLFTLVNLPKELDSSQTAESTFNKIFFATRYKKPSIIIWETGVVGQTPFFVVVVLVPPT